MKCEIIRCKKSDNRNVAIILPQRDTYACKRNDDASNNRKCCQTTVNILILIFKTNYAIQSTTELLKTKYSFSQHHTYHITHSLVHSKMCRATAEQPFKNPTKKCSQYSRGNKISLKKLIDYTCVICQQQAHLQQESILFGGPTMENV